MNGLLLKSSLNKETPTVLLGLISAKNSVLKNVKKSVIIEKEDCLT